tara:strand:+ start:549 stop:722 length:174 start_codon:yes stop_codon:yes gene_type:complete
MATEVVANGLIDKVVPEHLIPLPYVFSVIGPVKTWVAKFDTEDDVLLCGLATADVFA